ncbi:potassium transporter [Halorientalis sp. IM1011]|uniref:cation:proton antiporter domain-containing protein n=1 Tax=Halorientalis sp. IM1011 TaxID=1932360 RepID=UPI00097CCDD8|nr:cation:proton antiporter [Halorientalis sp. IM1011]AQL43183.1 potassium transporter [Halorientalis sp. IM1011]
MRLCPGRSSLPVYGGLDVATGEIIPLVAAIIGLGVGAQLLAARFQVPSIIFLVSAGLILGPLSELIFGTRILSAATFGGALPAIVGLSVAIIVFEGAFHLRLDRIREAPAAALRLVTVGAAIALVGTAVTVRFALGQPWDLSVLIGALLVATGPTVVTPILDVVPVRERVAAALETEGIVNDVTAAIVAVVVFKVIIVREAAGGAFVREFFARLGIGLLIGVIVAAVIYALLKYADLSAGNAPRNARLLTFAGALIAYGAADSLASEAGVAAVATAGLLLGNADIPYEDDIESFKGDVTLIVLSFVFIALAALLDVGDLLRLGLPGLAVVAAVMLVIRPLLVFVSTRGDRFTRPEKLFISFVGPRGIIPASVATLFAVQMQAQGLDQQAQTLVGTVFLVIFVTVAIQGGFARYIAEQLNVIPMRVIIVGGGQVGRALAERLEDRGENVVIVEEDEQVVERTRNEGYSVVWGDGTDTDVLREAGGANAKTVVAATGDDDANLLIAQLSSSKFDTDRVIARANNPDNVEAFEELGVRTISSAMATAWAMDNQIERPALAHWMTDVGREGDVQEVEVTSEELIGRSIQEIGPELPETCLVALVDRDGEVEVPGPDYVIEAGDRVTLLGKRDAVRSAMKMVDPD